jgi:Sec-independent protein translocase protein TatA
MSTLRNLAPILIPVFLVVIILGLAAKRLADLGKDITKVTGTSERVKRGTAGKPKKKK